MGFKGFDFTSVHQIFDEHARLSLFDNDVASRRIVNLASLVGLDQAQFGALQPIQWPVVRDASGHLTGIQRGYSLSSVFASRWQGPFYRYAVQSADAQNR